MESVIIGTAGHVDHGKTMLISALTGVDTDRLKEEKERGISIELGFAAFPLSSGRLAGIIDVPGHERFINNMLAGAAGIDLVLLVIDASEGVMAQTREHLNILELLGLQKGMVVITKTDMVEEEWCDMVEEEIREELKGTFLNKAHYCRVSAVTGSGIDDLKDKLNILTEEISPRNIYAPMRLPVDRAFTISGFGTIVTGTLLQGKVDVGETVETLPSGDKARVRNLQVFGDNVNEAFAGQRVAMNLAGLEKSDVSRGDVVCKPGFFHTTSMIDASLTLLKNAPRPLKSLDPVHLYLGTTRVVSRVALLEKDVLMPGESSLIQLRLESPLVAERKDRYIIRSYSPVTTIGGGVILDPFSERRPRRTKAKVLDALRDLEKEIKESGEDRYFLIQKLKKEEIAGINRLDMITRLGKDRIQKLLSELIAEEFFVQLDKSYLTAETFEQWESKVVSFLSDYHKKNSLSTGVHRAALKGILPSHLSTREYDAFLERLENKNLLVDSDRISLKVFEPVPTKEEEKLVNEAESILKSNRFQPPFIKDLAAELKIDLSFAEIILEYMVNKGQIVKINEDMYLHHIFYKEAIEVIKKHFKDNETITMAQFRDYLESTRKYVQPLLEFFDELKLTRRNDDFRIPRNLFGKDGK